MQSYELINIYMKNFKSNASTYKNMKRVLDTSESCANVLKSLINDFVVKIHN